MKRISQDGHGIVVREKCLYYMEGDTFHKYDFEQATEISREAYLLQKYGVQNKYWNHVSYEVVHLKTGHFITVFYQDNIVRYHASDGQVLKELPMIQSPYGTGIYGMTLDANDKLWIAVPAEHYIGQFDIETGEELFSINGEELEPTIFDHPEYVTAIGDKVYIADMGNQRILSIDIQNYERSDFEKLEDRIYYFNQVDGKNIYLLQSGIYIS